MQSSEALSTQKEDVRNKIRQICPLCTNKQYRVIFRSTFNINKHLTTKIFSARRFPDLIHGTIVKCTNCGLVRTLEVINPMKLKILYQKSAFTYQNLTNNLKTTYGRILKDASKYTKKGSLLEIGCGNGFLLEEAIKIGFNKVAGVEPSLDAFHQANYVIKSAIKVDILRQKQFHQNSFDLIAAFQVFDHIANPNKFLSICHSLLKPEGILVLMNHDVASLSAKILGEKSPIYDIEHPFLYSQNTIRRTLENNNYKVMKIYSPTAIFNLKYCLRLLPLPASIKKMLELSKSWLLNINFKIKPGNIAVYAQK